MRKASMPTKMRWIAGGLYSILFIFQLFLLQNILTSMQYAFSFANLPVVWLVEIALTVVSAVVAIKLFAQDGALEQKTVRMFVFATFFLIIYELFTYTMQTEMLAFSFQFSTLFAFVSTNKLAQYILIVLRLMLLILASFFVSSAQAVKVNAEEEQDDTDEIEAEALEALAEEVLIELEKEDEVITEEQDTEKVEEKTSEE